MKKYLITSLIVLIIVLGVYLGSIYYRHLRGIKPAVTSPPADIAALIEEYRTNPNMTDFPLVFPAGFELSIFARDLGKPRVMAFDSMGDMYVSRTREGIVSKLHVEEGTVVSVEDIYTDLNHPHGMVFDPTDPETLILAEEHRISRIHLPTDTWTTIAELPDSGGHRNHFTRTLGIGPDGRLYVSIGSSCNVCEEEDERRTKIFTLNVDGSDWRPHARGLRNTVFFDWDQSGRLWGADMGRDQLGDDLPPDEINLIEEGRDYGYPICYGRQIHDTDFDTKTYGYDPCEHTIPSHYDLGAHVAPLGTAIIPESSGWGNEYVGDLLVALHGSWNRSDPVGYSVLRLDIEVGSIIGEEDFITGWLTAEDTALGRPVALLFRGSDLYLSDDHAGVIYLISK